MVPDAPSPAETKNSPVSIRLGELEPRVRERAASGSALPGIIRRDLTRYYEILDDEHGRAQLSEKQAAALVDGVGDRPLDSGNWQLIWAMVEAYLRDHPERGFCDAERTEFTEALRTSHVSETLYIVDALERFRIIWGESQADFEEDAEGNWEPREEAFFEAGLTLWSPRRQFKLDQHIDDEEER